MKKVEKVLTFLSLFVSLCRLELWTHLPDQTLAVEGRSSPLKSRADSFFDSHLRNESERSETRFLLPP